MDGRFEDYTLGRNIEMARVKEIYRLFKKHGFQLAALRSFGQPLKGEDFAHKRALAEALRADPAHFARVRAESAARLKAIPVMSKGVPARRRRGWQRWAGLGLAAGLASLWVWRRRQRAPGR
jgi:hypothetical protein